MNNENNSTGKTVGPTDMFSYPIRYKRFIYKCLVTPQVGIVNELSLTVVLDAALGQEWGRRFKTPEKAYEATFRYGSVFVAWIDTEWVEQMRPAQR